ncbi:uncharacterized protein HaLaN_06093 [Haematococcus lacustris]|uniref:Uncharacterized protein n=1 Tax=Haematococcus lacustris TaxID=44745 RepID=A0A699YKH2_HAELA|nr:uncharacterized protein HaLaN_06093 [Haematococcus lacustris]
MVLAAGGSLGFIAYDYGRSIFPDAKIDDLFLPARVAAVADSIRRLSRLLWNVHLSLADDFDPAFKALLATHYPPDLLPHLASSFAAAIEALITAFPKNRVIAVDHLHAVAAAVKTLQATSDKRHRRGAQA